MDKTDRLRDYGLAFLLYKQGLSVCGYELIRELFIFIKLILNSYLTCDIQIIETEEVDGTVKVKYVITRVRKFPHYHRVNEAEEQNINFE